MQVGVAFAAIVGAACGARAGCHAGQHLFARADAAIVAHVAFIHFAVDENAVHPALQDRGLSPQLIRRFPCSSLLLPSAQPISQEQVWSEQAF